MSAHIVNVASTVRIVYRGMEIRVEEKVIDYGWERVWSADRLTVEDACEKACAKAQELVAAIPYEYDPAPILGIFHQPRAAGWAL